MVDIVDKLRRLDVYPKTLDEFRVRTDSGAVVSVFAFVFMFILFISELRYSMRTQVADVLYVDGARGQKLDISFDLLFHRMPCDLLNVDVMDQTGDHQHDVNHYIRKRRVDSRGKPYGTAEFNQLRETLQLGDAETHNATIPAPGVEQGEEAAAKEKAAEPECGSCYGAGDEGQCCNTCESVRAAYRDKGWALRSDMHIAQCKAVAHSKKTVANEGCNVFGTLTVDKVAGNFHFAPGKSFSVSNQHVHDLVSYALTELNMSHTINYINFGPPVRGFQSPLQDVTRSIDKGSAMFQYYLQVVPTDFSSRNGTLIQTNQYSATEHTRDISSPSARALPGVFVYYDISPVMVRREERRRGWGPFLTSVCSVIGGVFTVMGLVDKGVYALSNKLNTPKHSGKGLM